METWVNILSSFGLGTLMVLAIGYGLWRSVSWAGRELILPARDRFLVRVGQFFDRLDGSLDRIETTAGRIESTAEKIDESQAKMANRMEAQYGMCHSHGEHLAQILKLKQEARR